MKRALRFVLAPALALFLSSSVVSTTATAQYGPVFHRTIVSGVYAGWGWYPIVQGLWGWNYYDSPIWSPYGFSYFSYWDYLPYYATFGAIAYSPSTNRVGMAWGQFDRWDALDQASAFCGVDDCEPVVWVQGGCATVTKSPDSPFVGFGYHAYKHVADTYAMRACTSAGLSGCRRSAWVCSY